MSQTSASASSTGELPPTDWEVLDWRRRVAALYATVRATQDPADGHAIWVAERGRLLASHPASPVAPRDRETYAGMVVAPYDPAFRFVVPVDTEVPQVTRQISTATDGEVPLRRIGRVTLEGIGGLDVWWVGVYGGGILLPVRDATSGTTTYGGGRYILDSVKGADLGGPPGSLVVDLNFAYQPSCAYDERWVCPLPGPGNTVAMPVHVGEQYAPVHPGRD